MVANGINVLQNKSFLLYYVLSILFLMYRRFYEHKRLHPY